MKIAISTIINQKPHKNTYKFQEKTSKTEKQNINNANLLSNYLDNMALVAFVGSHIDIHKSDYDKHAIEDDMHPGLYPDFHVTQEPVDSTETTEYIPEPAGADDIYI